MNIEKYENFIIKLSISNTAGSYLHKLRINRHQFCAAKVLISLLFIIISILFEIHLELGTTINMVPILFVSAITGFLIPDFYIVDKIADLKFKKYMEIPILFDMLGLFLSTDDSSNPKKCIINVAKSLPGEVGKDIRSIDVNLNTNQYLQELENKINDPSISELANIIKLSNKYGGEIAEKIKALAKESYSDRITEMKASSHKASGKLLIPIVLFHLPVIIILLILPALIIFSNLL